MFNSMFITEQSKPCAYYADILVRRWHEMQIGLIIYTSMASLLLWNQECFSWTCAFNKPASFVFLCDVSRWVASMHIGWACLVGSDIKARSAAQHFPQMDLNELRNLITNNKKDGVIVSNGTVDAHDAIKIWNAAGSTYSIYSVNNRVILTNMSCDDDDEFPASSFSLACDSSIEPILARLWLLNVIRAWTIQ